MRPSFFSSLQLTSNLPLYDFSRINDGTLLALDGCLEYFLKFNPSLGVKATAYRIFLQRRIYQIYPDWKIEVE